MVDVVAIGEVLVDFVQDSINEAGYPVLSGNPGGAPVNFLTPISKYGLKTSMISRVGNDYFGKELIKTMKAVGIKTNNVVLDSDTFTTLAFVTNDKKGDRSFSFARKPGADTKIAYKDINLKDIDNCKVLHFGTLSLTNNPSKNTTYKLVDYAIKKGKLISFDPNYRKSLWSDAKDAKEQMLYGLKKANIVKISDDEVKFLFKKKAEESLDYIMKKFPNIKILYVTCGKDGTYYATRNFKGHVEALKDINVVDTTGAGDIFGGSALYKLLTLKKKIDKLSEQDMFYIATFASTVASLSTTKYGGLVSVPKYSEVKDALISN